jgi:hypothetical protein
MNQLFHFLWVAHIIGTIISSFYIAVYYIPKDLAHIWNKELGYSTPMRIFGTLACPIVWAIRAFFWEYTLPYLKISKFREIMNDYLFWY